MWRNSHFFFPLFFCLLPIILVLGMTVLFIVVPILQAPSVATMARYTRKLLRGRPDASDDELRRILRTRFLPDWVTDKGPEVRPFVGGGGGLIVVMLRGMRSYLLEQVVESRIHRAIEAADSHRDD